MQKIGIICAMDEELESIVSSLGVKCEEIQDKGFLLHKAIYHNYQLVFILCGIGKVNAAVHTQYLINKEQPDYVINVGVAGSLSPDLLFGDVVIASDLVQHDVDVTGFGLPLGQIPRMDVFAFSSNPELLDLAQTIKHHAYQVVVGRVVTGDQFIDNKEKAELMHTHFNALACEMEGAAIAQACHINGVPFIAIRALSDMAGRSDTAVHSFEQLKLMTANRSAVIIKQLLELM